MEGEIFRAAFKQPSKVIAGLSSRKEFECDVTSWIESPAMLPNVELKSKLIECIDISSQLYPLVTVDMQRQIMDLNVDDTKIELVTDHGKISANGRSVELFEVEFEFKSGELQEINMIGDILKEEFDLIPSELTKHRIGLGLLGAS